MSLNGVAGAEARIKYRGTEGPPLDLVEFEGMMVLTGEVTGILQVEGSLAGST